MVTRSPKETALEEIENLPESVEWAEIVYSLERRWVFCGIPEEIFRKAIEVLGNEEKAVKWLTSGQKYFNGEIPLEACLAQQGRDDVLALLGRIEHGGYS